ncbi:MAG: hypothetical protein AAGF82_09430, partial [Pseudomonadota bacterium]
MTNTFGDRLETVLHASRKLLSKELVNAVSVSVFSLIVLGTLALAYFNPIYNWDILAYVGIAAEDQLDSAEDIHKLAYGEVREAASELQFYKVTASIPYRVNQYEQPEHFVSLFPMFRVKVGYIEAIKQLGSVTGRVHATTIISTVSAALVGLFILVW